MQLMSEPTLQRKRVEKAELGALLASGIFAKSPSLARLLNYVCQMHWEGKEHQLKEYNLGVEALGRPDGFDPSTNAIVRVEAHRLRERLKKYYEGEGASHRVAIVLQPGSYVPHFVWNGEPPEDSEELIPTATRLIPVATLGAAGLEQVDRARDLPAGRALAMRRGHFYSSRTFIFSGFAAIVIVAGVLALLHFERAAKATAPAAAESPQANSTPAAVPALSSVRIIAGYSRKNYIDRAGNIWRSDAYYHGGDVSAIPDHFIFRTQDPTLFRTFREGEFSYDIPLKPGSYELWLYFIEPFYGPDSLNGGGEGSRLFDIQVNGKTILSTFDIYADAGGDFIADPRVFKNIRPASDGYLHLSFLRRTENPMLCAVKVIPGVLGKLRPIRLVSQDDSYTDHQGQVWNPDDYFTGGRLIARHTPVTGSTDPGLVAGERYGNFGYAIPVAPGIYALSLYFAERYFGPTSPGGGGTGSRLFNVACNNRILLKDFDVFKTAGGADRVLVETFHKLPANSQGKLMVRFIPVTNYAFVNAIEVRDESR
jgi:hypothetical protein